MVACIIYFLDVELFVDTACEFNDSKMNFCIEFSAEPSHENVKTFLSLSFGVELNRICSAVINACIALLASME